MIKKMIAFETLPVELLRKDWEVMQSNPQYWKMDGVRAKFEYVYAPSFPEIEEAYEKEGKTIFRADNNESSVKEDIAPPSSIPPIANDPPVSEESVEDNDVQQESEENVEETVTEDDFTVDDVKTDFRSMKWLELRTFAKQYTDEVIKNKEHALEILEQLESEGRL